MRWRERRRPRPGPDWRKAPDPDSIWRMNHPPRCDILNIQTFVILMIFYWTGAQKDLQFCRQESEKARHSRGWGKDQKFQQQNSHDGLKYQGCSKDGLSASKEHLARTFQLLSHWWTRPWKHSRLRYRNIDKIVWISLWVEAARKPRRFISRTSSLKISLEQLPGSTRSSIRKNSRFRRARRATRGDGLKLVKITMKRQRFTRITTSWSRR